MKLTTGTFPWLLAHDVRLNWRRFAGLLGDADRRTIVVISVAGCAILHLLAWPVALWLSPYVFHLRADVMPLLAFVVCTFTWMIAQSLFGTARALYDRSDLDLLLGSPQATSRVLAAKAAGIAASTFGAIAILALPVANAGAVADRAGWLSLYPLLIAMALIATGLAMAISIGLFFLLGPRRARVYTQLIGAGIGGAFVLAAQVAAMLPAHLRHGLLGWFDGIGRASGSASDEWRLLPVMALRGDAASLVLLLAIGLCLFAAASRILGDRFAAASLATAGAPIDSEASQSRRSSRRFGRGLGRNLRRKEWRLLARDPSLFAQLALQIIYTIPVAVVLLRNEALPVVLALAPTLVVVASQVAASLAWITVSGEDAPELIASAPVASAAIDRTKLGAVALPVLVILALPLVGLAWVSPAAALLTLAFVAAAGASTALLNFWHPMPGNRRGMLRRHSQSKLVALVEHGLAVLWAVAIVLTMLSSMLAVAPALVAVAILAMARYRHGNATRIGIGASGEFASVAALPRAP